MGNFQNIFKQLRIASGLTQEALSKKIGISRSAIGMYETGARDPDLEILETIADFFNVDVDYLLGRTNKTTVLPETAGKYYLDDETAKMAQEMYEDADMRTLFDMKRNMPADRFAAHVKFMKELYEKEHPSE